jgi:hypothetical protein
MVMINRSGEGTCIWCVKFGDGVDVEFKDGLKGFTCKSCFWKALKVRTEKQNGKTQPPSTPHASR